MKGRYIRRYNSVSQSESRPADPPRFRRIFAKILVVCMLGLLGGGLYYAMWQENLSVQSVEVVGNDELKANLVSRTYEYWDSRKNWWYNPYNTFLVPVDDTEVYLRQKFPALAYVEMKRSMRGVITIQVQVSDPVIAVCGKDNYCGEVSAEGVIIGFRDRNDLGGLLPVFRDFPRKTGELILSPREVAWLHTIQTLYRDQLGLNLIGISIVHSYESQILSVQVLVQEGYVLHIDFETDIVAQAEVLRKVFEIDLGADRRTNLAYIDLRIPGRVYYKMK